MKLVEINSHTNQDAIDLLREALKKAEAGELSSVGVAWVTKSNSIGGDVSSGPNQILMYAALEHCTKSFYMANLY